jgi:hypothetical protein
VPQDILSNEFGSCRHLTLSSGDQEVKNDLNLVDMVFGVILDLHELADEGDHAWEFILAQEYLMDKQLLIALLFNFAALLGPKII